MLQRNLDLYQQCRVHECLVWKVLPWTTPRNGIPHEAASGRLCYKVIQLRGAFWTPRDLKTYLTFLTGFLFLGRFLSMMPVFYRIVKVTLSVVFSHGRHHNLFTVYTVLLFITKQWYYVALCHYVTQYINSLSPYQTTFHHLPRTRRAIVRCLSQYGNKYF